MKNHAAILMLLCISPAVTSAQSGTTQPPAKKVSLSPTADKSVLKHFLKIHTLIQSCVTPVRDSSNPHIIKRLVFRPAQHPPLHQTHQPPIPDPFCSSGELVSSTNAATIADPKALGSDTDYELDAVAPNKIAIYLKASKPPIPSRLADLENAIDELAGTDFNYAEIIAVPPGKAKVMASQVSSLNSGGITASPLDGDEGSSILLKSRDNPDSAILDDLKQRIFDLRWQIPVASPTQRLFHLDAATVVKNLSGSQDGPADKPASDKTSSSKTAPTGGGDSATSTSSPTVSVTVTPPGGPGATATKMADGASAPSDSAKPSDVSPTPAKKPSIADVKGADSTPKPLSMQAVNDTLVYSNGDGTDRGMYERNRLMAVLDLPRPEVLLNMWALQASSRDYKLTNAEAEAVHGAVAEQNQILQKAIDEGWDHLSKMTKHQEFFNRDFYDYITQRFAVEQSSASQPYFDKHRREWGWCSKDKYCLGFSHAFEPLRPTFTNILMAIIAAKNSQTVAQETIQHMEGGNSVINALDPQAAHPVPVSRKLPNPNTEHKGQINEFQACLDRQIGEIQTERTENGEDDCELTDRLILSQQLRSLSSGDPHHEHLQLSCFRRQSDTSFNDNDTNQTTRIGLLRAAIADFLFNYKWASQYPHNFIPYDLSQSAQELNAQLNPLILAFNRDVAAFAQVVQTEMQCKYSSIQNHNWFGRGDETFLNDGMIGVRGISGVESVVDTVTQSFFDATKPPSLTDLVKSVSDAEQNIPGVLKTNLSANEAAVLLGALNSVKPAEAKIGRQLKLDITPHALAGASSAELDVKLTAEEAGTPTLFTADKSTEDNLSRVATHDTTTKVRVESLKLFEVSAFSAMLQRPRSRFPILPPLFEVPYFGSFISFPIPGAKVYHRSTAIVSAVIVPTAADLAYGIDFAADRICEEASEDFGTQFKLGEKGVHYVCHRASAPDDFNGLPLRNYHKAVVQCLVSKQRTAYTGNLTLASKLKNSELAAEKISIQDALTHSNDACDHLNFGTVPPSE